MHTNTQTQTYHTRTRTGTLLLDIFSLWSHNGDNGVALARPLSITHEEVPYFRPRTERDMPTASQCPLAAELLEGPFGHVKSFVNHGETAFRVDDVEDDGNTVLALGAVNLTPNLTFFPALVSLVFMILRIVCACESCGDCGSA
jgi:hypothetical protein